MVILHVGFITENKASGVSVVVPKYAEEQAKYENVALLNIGNFKLDEKIGNAVVFNGYDKNKPFSEQVSKPFNRPDIVIFHEVYKYQYIKLYKEFKSMGIPYIIIPHGSLNKRVQHKHILKKFAGNLLLFKKFICGARAVQFLTEKEANSSKHFNKNFFVLGNGISVYEKANFKDVKKSDKFKFIFIGRFDIKVKGIDILLKACNFNKDFMRNNKIVLEIYGKNTSKGNGKKYIEKYIKNHDIGDIVSLNPGIYDAQKVNKILESDIFIQTSRNEGQPLSVLEALGYGKPVIVTPGTSFAETVEREKMGWKAEQNYQSVALKMQEAYKYFKENGAEIYSKNSGEYIGNNFIWEIIASKAIEMYKDIIDRNEKINVLHVVKVLNRGGAETMIMNIYRNINREKIQFSFLCLSEKKGNYEDEIKSLGGKIYKVPDPRGQGRIENFYNIYKVMKRNKFNVVHTHIMFYNGFINLIAYFAKIKLRISHSHSHNSSGLKNENLIRKIYITFSRILINAFSNVKIACGDDAGKYLYGKNKKYILLNNAIDLDEYFNVSQEKIRLLKKELNIPDDALVIGHVGRFDKAKNQEFFIGLANQFFAKNIEKFRIVLVGQGDTFERIKNKIKDENLEEYFILTGLRKDIPVIMNMFDVFVMPSLYEGFPLVVVEALAGNNICFLSNKIPKETQIIKSRVNFFDLEADKEKLIDDIYQKLQNKDEIDIKFELNKSGFSIKEMVKKISNIYESKS